MNDQFRVLVADDEFWIRQNLRGIFDWEAHSFIFLEPAEDGEQALERIYTQHPDIVITDVNMPFISGTDLINTVCAENDSIVFIALSGYSDYEYVRAALVAGAIDYILKPVTKGDLLAVLNKAVERISKDRLQSQEERKIKEKLRIATGTAIDRELSQLIHQTKETEIQDQIQSQLTEYELDFSGFTMVVFHTAILTKILRKRKDVTSDQLILEIKQQITNYIEFGKYFVFHYTFKTNEFILVTDMSRSKLENICRNLVKILRKITWFSVTAVFSRHYIAFSDLRNAYNETTATLLSQPYCMEETILFPDNFDNHNVLKRITTEQEKQLQFAVTSGNRSLFQRILFEEISLFQCIKQNWSYAEVKQTVDSVSWFLRDINSIDSTKLLILDNLAELLIAALDGFDVEEMRSILEQMIDEAFEVSSVKKQSEGIRQTVMRVKEFIDQNYFDDLWLTGLSQKFNIESSYLSRTFKNVVGENLMLYISRKRVEKAKILLCGNELNITDIALMVGYDDYSYFSRVFRKITGLSPREYREKQSHA
ncbi:MAG: response regulator [Holosporaceae bacterium]|jgi:YesN/AraC family two-component response regulator|nr:response regulator [Holosporaceae bacterium]